MSEVLTRDDANLFAAEDIPWHELAFPIVERTLKKFLDDWAKVAPKTPVMA